MPPASPRSPRACPPARAWCPIIPAPDLPWMTALLGDARVACVLVADALWARAR